jgi:hypothetical protein
MERSSLKTSMKRGVG